MKIGFGTAAAACLSGCFFSCSAGEDREPKIARAPQAVRLDVGAAEDPVGSAWPLLLEQDGARIVLYQIHPEALVGDRLTARAAVSVTPRSGAEPEFGTVWIDARIATDRDARLVTLVDVEVTHAAFDSAGEGEQARLADVVAAGLADEQPTYSLDELIATLDPAVQVEPLADDLRHDPPRIVFARQPTALVTIDGEPKLRAIQGSRVQRVLNTPFVLLFDPEARTWWIRAGVRWMRSDALAGAWRHDTDPPQAVTSALPRPTLARDPFAQAGEAGEIDLLVATEPTELIVARGDPRWTPIEGTQLSSLENSENDVFLDAGTRTYWVLLGGRWYSSPALDEGRWTWVPSDALPADFARIPPGSPAADVRAFVAGTDEAREAAIDASIPQTAVVKRDDASCSVTYDGEPRFEDIPGTPLRWAVNTESSVIEYQGRYYCCSDGVWYVSEQPTGPWTVSTDVPDPVYDIPASSPVHHVRYVYVYDSTPEHVYVGYLPGYTGCYVSGPTIVYGTGWWYPGWVGVAYYPHPWTWGFHPYYDPWHCSWSFGFSFAWGAHPWWFCHSFGWGHPGWWGPGGFHGHGFAIHGNIVRSIVNQGAAGAGRVVTAIAGRENVYNREANRARTAPVPALETHRRRAAAAIANDVYAGRDGRVLRRTPDGWEERRGREWRRAEQQPAAPGPAAGRLPPERRVPEQRPVAPGERARPLPPPTERARPVPPPTERARPTPRPPPERARPVPRPPTERVRPQPPPERVRPVPPRPSLRQRAVPGGGFERMHQARQRGNVRSAPQRIAPQRQAPPRRQAPPQRTRPGGRGGG